MRRVQRSRWDTKVQASSIGSTSACSERQMLPWNRDLVLCPPKSFVQCLISGCSHVGCFEWPCKYHLREFLNTVAVP